MLLLAAAFGQLVLDVRTMNHFGVFLVCLPLPGNELPVVPHKAVAEVSRIGNL